jgi:magnesium-transporting ATPase (P-type)
VRHNRLLLALLDQLRSPLSGILAAGAGVSLLLGSTADVFMIGAMLAANAAIGTWQEREAGRAAEALEQMGAATATVLRDGQPVTVPASEVVPGDVLLLAPGDRVAADARILSAHGLEVDEAALTGESLPVVKAPDGGTDASRIVLEGSDVTVGAGKAVVVAVGHQTRLGATAAALALDETQQSPLGIRLSKLLRQFLPIAAAGGALVVGAGVLWGEALLPQLAIGASLALTAVPEGLPLLAGVGQAGVARRLAGRHALVRRLAAIEALGRVDVACTDKTGTLAEGRLALQVVADTEREGRLPGPLPESLRHVLLTAALASPHPDAPDASAHPTDVAVVRAAEREGLGGNRAALYAAALRRRRASRRRAGSAGAA